MPALERFCHIEHDLEFPELKEVLIISCPKIMTFAPGFVHSPNLKDVKFSYSTYDTLWKGNLNGPIPHLHERQQQRRHRHHEQDDDDHNDDGDSFKTRISKSRCRGLGVCI